MSTPGHKYFLPETKEWIAAESLKIGTKVLLSDGSYGIIANVREIHYDEAQTTYNFEVADVHTYYVGNGVLVHNMNGQPCGGKPKSPKQLSKSEIKKFDAHEFKYSELGDTAKISSYDIYKDTLNGNAIWLNQKINNVWIPTEYTLDELFLYFPLRR